MITFQGIAPGDLVQARVGNERLWFRVLNRVENNALICELASTSACGAAFDGKVTLDRAWIMNVHREKLAANAC